jgi:hypothetical protein
MSGLRCWPGALAFPTGARNPKNRATLVQCLRIATADELEAFNFTSFDGPVWVLDRPLKSIHGHMLPLCRDKTLTPITPPPGTEDTPTTADKPQPVEAA